MKTRDKLAVFWLFSLSLHALLSNGRTLFIGVRMIFLTELLFLDEKFIASMPESSKQTLIQDTFSSFTVVYKGQFLNNFYIADIITCVAFINFIFVHVFIIITNDSDAAKYLSKTEKQYKQ